MRSADTPTVVAFGRFHLPRERKAMDSVQRAYYAMRDRVLARGSASSLEMPADSTGVTVVEQLLAAKIPKNSPWKATLEKLRPEARSSWAFDDSVRTFQAWTQD